MYRCCVAQHLLQHLGTLESIYKLQDLRDPTPIFRETQVPDYLNSALRPITCRNGLLAPYRSPSLGRIDYGPGNFLRHVFHGLELDLHLSFIVGIRDLGLEELWVPINERERPIQSNAVLRKDCREQRGVLLPHGLRVVVHKGVDAFLENSSEIIHGEYGLCSLSRGGKSLMSFSKE